MLASTGHPVVVLFCSVHARCTASTRGAGMTRDTMQAAGQPHERVRTAWQSGGQPSRRQSADLSCTRHQCPQPHSDGWLRNARRRAGCSAARRRRQWGRAAPLRRRARRPAHTPPCCSARSKRKALYTKNPLHFPATDAAASAQGRRHGGGGRPCRRRMPAAAVQPSPRTRGSARQRRRQPCRFPTLQKRVR